MIQRVHMIMFVRGLVAVAGVLLAVVLAIMALDATVVFYRQSVRWIFFFSGFALVSAAFHKFLVRPLTRPLSLTRMARVLETRYPDMQERISSAIELAVGEDYYVSKELIDLLEQDAESDVKGVMPKHEFTTRSIKPFLVASAALALVLSLLFAIWPQETWLLLLRTLLPHREFDTLHASQLVVDPGDITMLEREELRMLVQAPPRHGVRAEIIFAKDEGLDVVERMKKVSLEGAKLSVYELRLPSVSKSFEYRVRYGLGLTKTYFVTVVNEPALTQVKLSYVYPAYTGLIATQIVSSAVEPVYAVQGTRLAIDADFNRTCTPTLHIADLPLPAPANTNALWLQCLSTNRIGRWSIAMRDSWGFTNIPVQVPWVVLPDRKPQIQLKLPEGKQIQVPPHDSIDFFGSASDDFGFSALEIVIRSSSSKKDLTLPLIVERGGDTWAELKGTPDLMKLYNLGIRGFKLTLRAVDNRSSEYGGPQIHESRVINISLKDNAKPLREQQREQTKKEMHKLLGQAKSNLERAAQEIAGEKHNFAKENIPERSQQKLEEARRKVIQAEDLLSKATEITEKTPFAEFADKILDLRDDFVAKAFEQVEQIPQTKIKERHNVAQAAENSLRQAASEINKLMHQELQREDQEQQKQSKLENLARREEQLAAAAGQQMDKQDMQKWEQEQNRAEQEMWQVKEVMEADEFAKALKELQEARTEMRTAQQIMTPEESQMVKRTQRVDTESEKAVNSAEDAAESALAAAQEAQRFAKMQEVAEALERASEKIKDAAKRAGEAAEQAQKVAEQAKAQAAESEQIMKSAQQAQDTAQQAADLAEKAVDAAQEAVASAQENDAFSQTLATRMKDASQMAQQAAELAQSSAEQSQQAETQAMPAVQKEAANDQAMESAKTAKKMAEAAQQMADLGSQQMKDDMHSVQQSAQNAAQQALQIAKDAQQSAKKAEQLIKNMELPAHSKAIDSAQQSAQFSQDAAQLAQASLEVALQESQASRDQAMPQAQQSEVKAQQALDLAQQARASLEPQQPALSQPQEHAAQKTENLADMMMQAVKEQQQREAQAWMRSQGRIGGRLNRAAVGSDNGGSSSRFDFRSEINPDWMRFKGEKSSESYEQMLNKTPPEYRNLVKQYFEELSKE